MIPPGEYVLPNFRYLAAYNVGFPFASLVLAFLNLKYENLISLLRQYLAELERVSGAQDRLPSYNGDTAYNTAAITTVVVGCLVAHPRIRSIYYRPVT